jgi:putative membrane protein
MATNTTDTRLVTIVLVLIGALVVLPALFMGFGMMGAGPMGGMGHDGMWGSGGGAPGWWPLAGILLQLAFLAAVVGLGYLLYRAVAGTGTGGVTGAEDPAIEELRLAYARGDLDEDEYERRRERLQREN